MLQHLQSGPPLLMFSSPLERTSTPHYTFCTLQAYSDTPALPCIRSGRITDVSFASVAGRALSSLTDQTSVSDKESLKPSWTSYSNLYNLLEAVHRKHSQVEHTDAHWVAARLFRMLTLKSNNDRLPTESMETKNCLDELLEVMMAQRCDDHSTDHPASQETAVEAGNSTSATRKAASHLDTLALAMLCKPLSSLGFIPALMTCYVAFRSPPSLEVQVAVSQHLRGSCEIRPSMYNISQPKAQKPQRHQVNPTSLFAITSLTPTLTFQTAKTAAAARAKCTHLWRSIGVLAALHVDVLSPDQVSEILLWSTESGLYDKELFEVVSWRIRDKEDGLSTAFMSRLKDSSLISMLRAIASARHQDKAVIEALVSEAAFRLGSKVDHSRHLSTNMSGRGFSLIDLSYLVTSLAVVDHQDAQLLTVASREAFGQLLQLVDKQELEDERTRDEHVQAGQAPPSHTEPRVNVEILVSMAWGLHAAGRSCQPVLLDALALLLPVPRSLQGLDLGGLLKLLEVCTAVTKAAMCEAGDASKAAGAKQLVGSVAEVLSERVGGLSVHQAARVGTLLASVHHYNEPLMRSICSFPAVAWSAAGWQCKDAWALPMPWGCLAELAAAAASLRYDPTTILGNVDAYAEALRSSLQIPLHRSSAHLLPSPSVLCKLAYASATLSRTDHHLLALVREVALQPESQASLSVRQLCELTWALAVSEHHLWKQGSVQDPQKRAAARVQSHKQQSSWVLKDVRKQRGLSAAWLDNVGGAGGDDNGRSSQEAKATAAVLSIFSLAMSQLSDVREPYVLQMCEAYLSLLSSLRGEHYQQLLSFPVQWRNTLQYAWEQQLKVHKRVKQKGGSSLFTQMLAVGPVYAYLEDDVEADSIGPLQMMEERKKLLTVLQSLGFMGALTDRMIKVGGFLVDADVTLETGSGQAVVVLLDSSQSYVRTESLPANANGHILKEERQESLRLMGQAAWRERLLGRAGWLVARIHWHDWRAASSSTSSKACENLVKMVLGTLLEE